MCPLIPQPHLLVEIVVKQDQVEVSLQALKRPLLDSGLAAASLRGRDPEGPAVKTGQLRAPNPIPGSQASEIPRGQPTLPFITLFCRAGSSCKHLTLSHLLWFTGVQGPELLLDQAFQFSMRLPREAEPRCMAPVPPTQSMLKQ